MGHTMDVFCGTCCSPRNFISVSKKIEDSFNQIRWPILRLNADKIGGYMMDLLFRTFCSLTRVSFQLAKKPKILSINSREFVYSARFGGPILRLNADRGHMMDLLLRTCLSPWNFFSISKKQSRILSINSRTFASSARRPRNNLYCFFKLVS